jgi:hypothetical protein
MSRLWLTTKVILKHLATASQVTASNRARQTASILTPPGHVVSLREDCTKCVRNNGFATALSLIGDKGYNPSTYEDSL